MGAPMRLPPDWDAQRARRQLTRCLLLLEVSDDARPAPGVRLTAPERYLVRWCAFEAFDDLRRIGLGAEARCLVANATRRTDDGGTT